MELIESIYKIVHINTDLKFVNLYKLFDSPRFKNIVIHISDNKTSDEIITIRMNDISKVIEICNQANVVIFYGLSDINKFVVTHISKNPIRIWRFFGYELYSRINIDLYSNKTIKILKKNLKYRFRYFLKQFYISNLIMNLKKSNENKKLQLIINEFDFFLCLSSFEYLYLSNFEFKLPKLIEIPMSFSHLKDINSKVKEQRIILNHNKYPFNNHIDLFDIVFPFIKKFNYNFCILFNYGKDDAYSKYISTYAKKLNINIIKDFMTYEELQYFYAESSTFVSNSYRENAVANIKIALKNGVKVYLNKKNIMLKWLKSLNFYIYTIEDFITDISSGNISLSNEQMEHNKNICSLITNAYQNFELHELLHKIINDNYKRD